MGAYTHVCIHVCAYIQLIVSHLSYIKKTQIEEFKSVMLDLIKYQQEQQLSLQKTTNGKSKENGKIMYWNSETKTWVG